MLQHPVPNADQAMLEHCTPEQLFDIFENCLKSGSRRGVCSELPDAWGTLFSGLYLSSDELAESMTGGDTRLPDEKVRMLREFIRADCATGGHFVLGVIVKGGMIDRAALIMVADIENLAGLEHAGTTALHLLADACDRSVRPALIRRAGVKLLSEIYDGRGMPVLFAIFALGDLSRDDLDAMADIFTEEELKNVMNRNRTGKNALEVFNESSERLKVHAPGERNKFFVSRAIRTTNMDGELRSQVNSSPQPGGISGAHVHEGERKRSEQDEVSGPSAAERYEDMMSDPLDNIAKMVKKTQGR